MNAIWQWFERALRASPRVRALMKRLGIHTVHYWLLVDLFGTLSDRRELPGHLGKTDFGLQKASWMFCILSGLMSLLFVAIGMTVTMYFAVFQLFGGFLLFTTLLSEANNSLMNPVEGLVLAHQPINGATYTAAKLTHILRVLLYLVPALSLIPAFAALLLTGAPWYYPLLHLATAWAAGFVLVLFCCALFGGLMRFVPPARLKAVDFAAEMSSWALYVFMQTVPRLHLKLHLPPWWHLGTRALVVLAVVGSAVSVAIVVFGLRALSGDYLVRVSTIAHGGNARKIKPRRSWLGNLVAPLFGGPTARAGFDYVWRMMTRDWYFRRQMVNLIPLTMGLVTGVVQAARVSPFSGKFSAAHLLPHVLGFGFLMIALTIPFGNDYKGAWLFLLAPAGAYRGVARGIYARLLVLILAPCLILLPVLAWTWSLRDAALFLGYSGAVSALYLALELRMIEGLPFSMS